MRGLHRRAVLAGMAASIASVAHARPRARIAQKTGFASVPGGKVWWQKVGHGHKTPILTLHGGPGAGCDYLEPLSALAEGRSVIFYDQLGCGRSDSPPDESLYRFPRFVEEVDAVRAALHLDRIILYGHSWGSMLAIEYLLDRGGHGVEKLILGGALASVPQATAGEMRLIGAMPEGTGARLHQLERENRTDSPEYQRLVELFYHLYLCRLEPWPAQLNKAVENLSKSPAYRIMNGPNEFTITGNIKDWDRSRDLGAIRLPTLLITGEFDEVTLDCHETIRDGIAGSQLVVLKGCSHMAMLEKPDTYNRTMRDFMIHR